MWALKRQIVRLSNEVIALYFHKVDKIPVIIESIRKYVPDSEIYEDILDLHRSAIISSVISVYDVLESDARISAKFRFLMKLSVQIPAIVRDGNFLYTRSLWMFYETASKNTRMSLDQEIRKYELLRHERVKTIFGLLFPIPEILPIKQR